MNERNRPKLVVVGGNGSVAERFQRAWPYLKERFDPVLVELAGQGHRSEVAMPRTLDAFAVDLAHELARAVPDGAAAAPVCYGHGIGGLVLAHAVRRLTWRPARLVLHAPVGARLARRRFPWLMAGRPAQALVRALLASAWSGPRLAARLFDPAGAATAIDARSFARGYRQARSFGRLFTAVDPLAALDGLETLSVPVTLLWGLADPVLGWDQILAWAEALPSAPVTARLVPGWRHYPYLDWPAAFAEILAECVADRLPEEPISLDHLLCYRPRTKAGRLAGMRRAGLPVPAGWWVPPAALENGSAERLFRGLRGRCAARSSASLEDQAGHTAAGVFASVLDVAARDLLAACRQVVASGSPEYLERMANSAPAGAPDKPVKATRSAHAEVAPTSWSASPGGSPALRTASSTDARAAAPHVDVLVQEMVSPRAGGVAWVRGLGVDLEITAGRIDRGVSGAGAMIRASLSDLGAPWTSVPDDLPAGLTGRSLRRSVWPVLRRLHTLFDSGTLDVEWAVDERGAVQILQARPVGERHGARRLLSAANLREVAPPDPSPFFTSAVEAVSGALPRYYARHDRAIATWHEPLCVSAGGRAYLNADLLTAIMDRWGLPRGFVSGGMGGRLPYRRPRPDRLLASLPAFGRLLWDFGRLSPGSSRALEDLRTDLDVARDIPALARWFERAFATLAGENLRITGALTTALPLWPFGAPEIVTAAMARELRSLGSWDTAGEGEAPAEPRLRDRTEAAGSAGASPCPDLLQCAFEARWGHRGEYETDPAWPRGEEVRVPETTLSPTARPALPDPLLALPAPLRRIPMLAPRHLRAHREWFRDSAMRLWAAFRAGMLGHAEAMVAAGYLERPEEIWLLTTAELQSLAPEAWRERVDARRAASPAPVVAADMFWSDTLAPLGATPSGRLPLVPGTVTGPALVARTPSEAMALLASLPPDGGLPVLIAPAVDPGWLPVFVRVGGVATELGGRLSHAATLLRELAIPSVLNLAGVMECARTGERVCLRVPPGTVEVI